jgi:hypothetical protein
MAVSGIVELLVPPSESPERQSAGSRSSAGLAAVFVSGILAVVLMAFAAGGWYARRPRPRDE